MQHPEYSAYKDFTSLDAWKKARLVRLFFYENVMPCLPSEEKYNLNTQIRKASVSGTANIADGYGRFYYQEGIQFYRMSRGSLYELKDHLIACYDCQFIDQETHDKGTLLIEDAKYTLNGYIKYIKSLKDKEP
jgi:four helix bundle protein